MCIRDRHGALLDAEILADVYLMMTGGQAALMLDASSGGEGDEQAGEGIRRLPASRPALKVIRASEAELEIHARVLDKMGEACLWKRGGENTSEG